MRLLIILLLLTIPWGAASRADVEDNETIPFTYRLSVEMAVDGFILPTYRGFAAASDALKSALRARCETPGRRSEIAARTAFEETVLAWSQAEILRFGPAISLARMERVAFWPDPKGIGARQLRRILTGRDPATLKPNALWTKSVAVQGLSALERLLYSKASGEGPGERFACLYAAEVAANVARIGRDILGEWTADGYSTYIRTPDFHNPFYRDGNAPPATLLSQLSISSEFIRDKKLLAPLGGDSGSARPRRTQWHRSGLGLRALRANYTALRDFYRIAGWSEHFPPNDRLIIKTIDKDFDTAMDILDGLGLPMDEAVGHNVSHRKLTELASITRRLQALLGAETAASLGIELGFTWVDGD